MRLWTDQNLPAIENADAFSAADSYAEKADILRYELLRDHGGVYVDCDFEPLRPLDDLVLALPAFAGQQDDELIAIGIMGSSAHHPLFEHLVATLPHRVARFQGVPVAMRTGPHFFTDVLQDWNLRKDCVIFDRGLFYPYHYTELHRSRERFPEAYAVHHWANSWGRGGTIRARASRSARALLRTWR